METKKENIVSSEDCNLINSAFFLFEAGDMLFRELERRFAYKRLGVRHETKKRVTDILNYIHKLEFCVEDLLKDYNDAYEDTVSEKYEQMRRVASYYARLVLLIGDRCNNTSDWEKEKSIIDFVKSMPSNGNICDYTLERLKII